MLAYINKEKDTLPFCLTNLLTSKERANSKQAYRLLCRVLRSLGVVVLDSGHIMEPIDSSEYRSQWTLCSQRSVEWIFVLLLDAKVRESSTPLSEYLPIRVFCPAAAEKLKRPLTLCFPWMITGGFQEETEGVPFYS